MATFICWRKLHRLKARQIAAMNKQQTSNANWRTFETAATNSPSLRKTARMIGGKPIRSKGTVFSEILTASDGGKPIRSNGTVFSEILAASELPWQQACCAKWPLRQLPRNFESRKKSFLKISTKTKPSNLLAGRTGEITTTVRLEMSQIAFALSISSITN